MIPGARFPKALRIRLRDEFTAVFRKGVRRRTGPLVIHARANGLPYPRLGLAVPRAAGNAVRRNRIKRQLREAFRLRRADLPVGFDFVVVVRRHDPLPRSAYEAMLIDTARELERRWHGREAP